MMKLPCVLESARALLPAALLLAAAPALAQDGPPAPSENALRLIEEYNRDLEAGLDVSRDIGAAAFAEQFARNRMVAVIADPTLSAADRSAFLGEVGLRLAEIDGANTAMVQGLLETRTLAELAGIDERVASSLLSIVQHSPDLAFQKRVLADLEPLAEGGVVEGQSYALLVDEVRSRDGELQLYGTNANCRDGEMTVDPMEDPESVDERRAALGMPRLAVYMDMLKAMYGSCPED
jgi:hypothetical protein